MSRVVRKLVKAGDVTGLIALSRDPASRDRLASLRGIMDCTEVHRDGILEARQAILSVCVPLVRDRDPQIRHASLALVILLRDPSAPSVAAAALSDSSSSVRVLALGVFHLQPPGCLDDVIRLLHDEDEYVRSFAAAAIERVGDGSAVAVLQEARTHEPEQHVRDKMAEVVDILEGRRPPTPIESYLEDG